jgi:hypothetical protein
MDKLQEIIKKLKLICSQENLLDISPNCILEQATDIYLSNKISESQKDIQMMKKENIANYQKDKITQPRASNEGFKGTEITPKQIYALKNLGYTKEEINKLNKQEAFKIIKESKE